ncbi:MAG: HEAT repeat domain-containing protein [Chloroflexi bacterium]|nr:HEAT repeat domain-containing protein [Chloroflexota bacterium]
MRFDPTLIDAFPPETEAEPLPTLVEELESSDDAKAREEAAESLGDLDEPEALPALIEAAESDESLAVRLAAETAIHKIGVDELIRLLLNHEDPVVREAAANGLRLAGTYRVVEALRQALSTDMEARVRLASAGALVQIGGEKAEQGLLDAALADEEAVVREVSVLGLGERKARWTAEGLVAVLRTDPDTDVRTAAAQTMGELQVAVTLPPLLDVLTTDPEQSVQSAARKALARWETSVLAATLLDNPDPALRAAAAEVLGSRHSLNAVPALTIASSDPDELVRNAAREALDNYGPITRLENGAGILRFGDLVGVIPDATAFRSAGPEKEGVFQVTGARSTTLLRSAVGAIYVDGQWLAAPQTRLRHSSNQQVQHGAISPSVAPHILYQDTITVVPVPPPSIVSLRVLAGLVPTSAHLERVEVPGTFLPESGVFALEYPVRSYSWTAAVHRYSEEQLRSADKAAVPINSPYTSLPEWARTGPVFDLAAQITAGHPTPYAQAKAIADYLRTNYDYAFANKSDALKAPDVQDPVERFLFVEQEGTCGNFSSAFVFLARAIGLPARVVSGWAISATPFSQTVSTDQAHQWAEVAFEGLGWVAFEPTPGGPQARAADAGLPTGDPEELEEALRALEESGAEVVRLENGAAIVEDGEDLAFAGGTTTAQVSEFPMGRVFKVAGAANTGHLRMATGDVYENGGWRQLDPVDVRILLGAVVPDAVWAEYASTDSQFRNVPFERRSHASLFGFIGLDPWEYRSRRDEITLFPIQDDAVIFPGVVPVANGLQTISLRGAHRPYSRTFRSSETVPAYKWTSHALSFSDEYLVRALAARDPTYLQLPPDMPERIRELALEVTAEYRSTYEKAKALERYLSTTFPYRLADGPEDVLPQGRDPVDWFLFDHKEGTCGVFSSVFVVMARSIGIPARVVSGFVINPTPDIQTVYAWQAHQWAEVAFEGLGWISFEPTASGAAPSRLAEEEDEVPEIPVRPLDTITTITQSPSDVRRQQPFTVGGWVNTATGRFVDGMKVEIYVNETKEHGGVKIGETVTRQGRYDVEVQLPPSLEVGGWQLLARAVENDSFNESWSDPDLTVYSGTGLQLTGPSSIPVDVGAVFTGKLSEDTGRGASNREITVAVNGSAVDPVMTDDFGRFTFTRAFADPGPHWVEVELKGQAFLLDNRARIDFEVTLPTETAVDVSVSVEVGEEFRITGTLRGVRGEPLTGRSIVVRVGDLPVKQVSTDADGAFDLVSILDEPGPFTVRAGYAGDGPILASQAIARVAVREAALLTLGGPSTVELGDGGGFAGRLAKADGSPIGQSTLRIVDAAGEELAAVTTDDDGAFQYRHEAFFQTGPHSLSVLYPGADFIVPSSARLTFSVLAPTWISLEAPAIVRDGESLTVSGTLRDVNGQPVRDARMEVVGDIPLTLTTGVDGSFRWETVALFDETASESAHESPLVVEVAFSGTDHLAASSAATDVVVGVPRLLLEPLEPVARGDTVTLRGTALLGARPASGIELTVEGDAVQADATGTFSYTHRVPDSAPLGAGELTVAAPGLDVSASASFMVKSAVRVTVTPMDKLRPGELAELEVRLLDDRRRSIRNAGLRLDDGTQLTTDGLGAALLEVAVPDDEEALTLPLTFTYDGDERHMPLTYFIGVPVTPWGFNWLLWAGAPGAAAALAVAGYAGSRMRLVPLPRVLTRRREDATVSEEALRDGVEDVKDEDSAETRTRVALTITFAKPAADIPDVWGVGEDVDVSVTAADRDGVPIAGAEVQASVAGEPPQSLVAGDDGTSTLQWTASDTGEYQVAAELAGNQACLPASDSRTFRVVDFREEIVRLYNAFLQWAANRTNTSVDQMTPREVELLLVSRELPVPQKPLDELISRFEEADYSEHPIVRRHYESMYRAWHAVVEE